MDASQMAKVIRDADEQGLASDIDRTVLDGYSGEKLIGALQRLSALWAGDPTACYLEIGVYQGLTLLSVAGAVPGMPCFGIDNFAFFDPDGRNLDIVHARRETLGLDNAILVNEDYEDAFERLDDHLGSRRIAVLFIDGPHDYRSQLMCLQLALPYLHRSASIVVDDSNYRHVRQANRDFLVTHPEFKLLFDAYTRCHPANMPAREREEASRGWWNGVNVIVHDPEDVVPRNFPPTERSRELFENEHLLHASPVAPFHAAAGKLLTAIDRSRPVSVLLQLARLKRRMRGSSRARRGLHDAMNTYSSDLPRARHHLPAAR